MRKLDVVKTNIVSLDPTMSLAVFNKAVKEHKIARLLDVTHPTSKPIDTKYSKEDDWDILITDDWDEEFYLTALNPGVYNSFPIVLLMHTIGYVCTKNKNDPKAGIPKALVEAAKFLSVTELWMYSDYHIQSLKESFERFLNPGVLQKILSKTKLVPMGIRVEKTEKPKPIGKTIKVIFPHRPVKEKGTDIFLEYAKELSGQIDVEFYVLDGNRNFSTALRNSLGERVHFFNKTDQSELFDLMGACNVVFSSAHMETFGMAVMEGTALGCIPVVPDNLCYPEFYPKEFRYEPFNIKSAVETTLQCIEQPFDNSFSENYFWGNIKETWNLKPEETYERFYTNTKDTEASEKIIALLKENSLGLTKLKLLQKLNWSQPLGWGKYRYLIGKQVPISPGPNPIFGNSEILESDFFSS